MHGNLHTHTHFSDGSEVPDKYCEEAIRQGFQSLGFSDHGPVPFPNTFALREERLQDYINCITDLKDKYSASTSPLQIFLGLEIDYIPGISEPFKAYRNEYSFDYLIGSVHLVKNANTGKLWFIDGPDIEIYDEGLKEVFDGNIELAVTSYFRQIQSMVIDHHPDIIGHFDKIKMYNRDRYYSENDAWYQNLVDETLTLISQSESIIEVNTRGLYKKRASTFFPGPAVLNKIRSLNIPVTVVSDAHAPHELSLCFEDAYKTLKMLGFKTVIEKDADGWKECRIA